MVRISTPKEIKDNNQGIFEFSVRSIVLDKYLQEELDLVEFKDYVIVINQTIGEGIPVKMLHFVSKKGFLRFVGNGKQSSRFVMRKWLIPDLKSVNYTLWR